MPGRFSGSYYNEFDPFAAQWLRNLIKAGLIADGDVDERSIVDVLPIDLIGYAQCHFFAGIGGWSYALRLAGWPDDRPVWTGSCPCQPFSAAGKGGGFADERHLWPEFDRLIGECRPAVVFGEQVASAPGLQWLDLVQADLEAKGYAVGAADICAAGVGAPHIRQRLYWVADAGSTAGQRNPGGISGTQAPVDRARLVNGSFLDGHQHGGSVSELADANGDGSLDGQHRQKRWPAAATPEHSATGIVADANGWNASAEGLQRGGQYGQQQEDGGTGELANPQSVGRRSWRDGRENGAEVELGRQGNDSRPGPTNGHWRDADWLGCTDGRWRPVEPGSFPLAYGIPNRVGSLRGYGNAIVPQVAAEFVSAFMACQP